MGEYNNGQNFEHNLQEPKRGTLLLSVQASHCHRVYQSSGQAAKSCY